MKELINDLINKSGHNNESFALSVGTSASYLSQQKRQKNINHKLLIEWAKKFNIETIEGRTKDCSIKINVKF